MTALYRWHPYELQAFFFGVLTGGVLAFRLAVFYLTRRRTNRWHG